MTANQPMSNYWIRANPSVGNTGFVGGINSAILKYINAPVIDRVTPDPTTPEVASTNPMLETNLHPLSNPGAPGKPIPGDAHINLNLNIAFNFSTQMFTVNNASFIPPTSPVLLQILSKAQTAQDLLPSGSVYVLPRNKVIEISLPGGSIGSPVSGSLIFFMLIIVSKYRTASFSSSRSMYFKLGSIFYFIFLGQPSKKKKT